ncbi:MAG: hypothetical protein E7190_06200 [Erysipelotrichaceae bacterium]|nr:hypothetical protein [Erysipelotrichaceae bacterium]
MENKRRKLNYFRLTILCAVLFLAVSGTILIARELHDDSEPEPSPSPSAEVTAEPVQTQTPEPTPTSTPTPTPEETSAEPADEYIFHRAYQMKAFDETPDNVTGFVSGWAVNTTDGYAYADLQWNRMPVIVENAGSSIGSVSVCRGGIPFSSGSEIAVSFTASSDIGRNIRLVITNGAGGNTLYEQTISVSGNPADQYFTFRSPGNISDGWVYFQLGNDGSSPGYHSVTLDNVRIISSNPYGGVLIDQVGYPAYFQKRCTFPYDCGDLFDVIDSAGNIVYSGAVIGKTWDEFSGQTNAYGDFSQVNWEDTFYIRSQTGIVSDKFRIMINPYTDMIDPALRMLSMQRCTEPLDDWWAGGMAHGECHNWDAVIYGTEEYMSVTGGWHDAGDYGKYVKTGAKAVDDLLIAYLANPDLWTDTAGIPQSNNGIPDLLDEARYELDWMLKMQSSGGGVYNTVIPENISEIVVPEADNQRLIVLYQETTTTGDFAGTMALASIVYKDIDPAFSRKCLEAAELALYYLDDFPDIVTVPNPGEINGGQYLDDTDNDARFFTYIALWAATFKDEYLQKAKTIFYSDTACADSLSWSDNGGYGRYLFLSAKDADRIDPDLYQELLNSLTREADAIMSHVSANGYMCSLNTYGWGSNSEALNNGVILSMAYDFTGNQAYQQSCAEQLHYVLGRNCLNLCYVTGFGTNSPSDIHSRVAKAKGAYLTGALVGGPDSYREDKLTQAMAENTPPARMYVDTFDSWSTNEVTVYYNSALLHILARIS